jgi:hypothetical protein
MPGLVPGIHAFTALPWKDVDGRDKPGHDAERAHRHHAGRLAKAQRSNGGNPAQPNGM